MRPLILLADDEPEIRRILSADLVHAGFEVFCASNGEEAYAFFVDHPVSAVVLDVQMPTCSGLQCLSRMRRINADVPAIVMTAFVSIENAVEAMKCGASDYVAKPFDSDVLVEKLRRLLETNQRRTREIGIGGYFEGSSVYMASVRTMLHRIKDYQSTVLITGESGTGKGVVAKELYRLRKNEDAPFIHVDCASLPPTLIEDELFGHEKGSFTGAQMHARGKFEQAQDGDIFLDEIGVLPVSLQAKLLNVLQERFFYRIGGTKKIEMNARVIAATNEDLEAAVKRGDFRLDLYYRLNVVEIRCIPLRQRKEDIPELAAYLFRRIWAQNRSDPLPEIRQEVYQAMERYDWPGNVRELENCIESIVVLSDGVVIDRGDLPDKLRDNSHRQPLASGGGKLSLKEQEMLAIIAAMERHNGNCTQAAKELGISRRGLYYKLNEYKLN